jgi:hypothetical protein
VRKFLQRLHGKELEVALEATTGWRFVVEELRRVGAEVHLAEPAETAGLRGPKKRAKGDRADARHLRELLMVKRLPESWIPPDHIRFCPMFCVWFGVTDRPWWAREDTQDHNDAGRRAVQDGVRAWQAHPAFSFLGL